MVSSAAFVSTSSSIHIATVFKFYMSMAANGVILYRGRSPSGFKPLSQFVASAQQRGKSEKVFGSRTEITADLRVTAIESTIQH